MTRLAEIEAHIGNMAELRDIIGAMRSLAGMRMQEAQRVLPGIRRYAETVSEAIGDALLLVPDQMLGTRMAPGRRAHRMCAAPSTVLSAASTSASSMPPTPLADPGDAVFILGSRGAVLAQERGWTIAWTYAMATRPGGSARNGTPADRGTRRLDRAPRADAGSRSSLPASSPGGARPDRAAAGCSRSIPRRSRRESGGWRRCTICRPISSWRG